MTQDDQKRTTPDLRAQERIKQAEREAEAPTVPAFKRKDVVARQKAAESPLQVILQDIVNFFRRLGR